MGKTTTNGNSRGTATIRHTMMQQPAMPHVQLSLLLPALSRHPKLDLKTMRYHAEQSDATAYDGYWHAAINEARSFMEALVISIAMRCDRQRLEEFRKGKESYGGIRLYRRYLYNIGFLDADEDILVTSVYSITSAKGGHFGVSDEPWCRVSRRIVWTTSDYLIGRYERWKAGERRPKNNTPELQESSKLTGWKGRLCNLFQRVKK